MPHLVWALSVVEALALLSSGAVVGFTVGRLRRLHVTQRRLLDRPERTAVTRVDRRELPAATGGERHG